MADDLVGREVKVLTGPWRGKRGVINAESATRTTKGEEIRYLRVQLPDGVARVFLPHEVAVTDKVAPESGTR